MAGKFVLKKGTSGKFHFNLVAGNGQVIATSETYESRESALNGIESVKANAPGASVDDQTRASRGGRGAEREGSWGAMARAGRNP
jgi:uncharacterized protein YegP (UPF0339 family)